MIFRRFLLLLLPALTLSCALPPNAPPLPATARTIAVLPPNNRTGDPLLVESASFLHPYADRPGRVTVPDVQATLCWSKAPHFCNPMRIVLGASPSLMSLRQRRGSSLHGEASRSLTLKRSLRP